MTTTRVELNHDEQGPPDAPVVMLAPSLGTTLAMWDDLAERLSGRYRVVRFDTRGHGASPTPSGPYTVSDLAADVVALADSLDVDRFAFVGLSLGGAIGQVLAVEHPDRLTALVLCCSGPSFGEPSTWRERAAQVRAEGMGFLAGPTRDRWFTQDFAASHPGEVDRLIDMLTGSNPEGYAACCEALASYDLWDRLGEVRVPTRVVAGAYDPVVTPEVATRMARALPHADLVVIDDASHMAPTARPDRFEAAVAEHLGRFL